MHSVPAVRRSFVRPIWSSQRAFAAAGLLRPPRLGRADRPGERRDRRQPARRRLRELRQRRCRSQRGLGRRLAGGAARFHSPDRPPAPVLRDGEFLPGSLIDVPLQYPDLGLDGEGHGVLVGLVERPELGGAEVDAYCTDIAGPAGDRDASASMRVRSRRLPAPLRRPRGDGQRPERALSSGRRIRGSPESRRASSFAGSADLHHRWERRLAGRGRRRRAAASRTSPSAATADSCWSGSRARRRLTCMSGRSSST